jgi:DNA (cytosine-5)-methyltransferase 1
VSRPTFLSLFSGIGGIDLGLERAGWSCVGQVEIDPFCQRVLARHWPDVPRWGDIREVSPHDLPRADLIAGGPPCQPFSVIGDQRGVDDERWLWPEMDRAVAALRPDWVLVENVPGLRGRGLDIVRCDLAWLGYRTRAYAVTACAVGAPHMRRRVFVVAHAPSIGRRPGEPEGRTEQAPSARVGLPESGDGGWWDAEPDVGRVAPGVPAGMDRRRALGNAVVPQVAELIGRRILEAAA